MCIIFKLNVDHSKRIVADEATREQESAKASHLVVVSHAMLPSDVSDRYRSLLFVRLRAVSSFAFPFSALPSDQKFQL